MADPWDVTTLFNNQAVPPGWRITVEPSVNTSEWDVLVIMPNGERAGRVGAPKDRRNREVRFLDVNTVVRSAHNTPDAIRQIIDIANGVAIAEKRKD